MTMINKNLKNLRNALLDSPGPVGAAAVRALVSFGQLAETEMRRCLARSMDEDQIRNAHRVLARLGDRASKLALPALCWADREALQAIEDAAKAAERLEEEAEAIDADALVG